jgi:hypothetical protein
MSLLNYYQGKIVNKHFLCSADAILPLHSIFIIPIFDDFYNRKMAFLIFFLSIEIIIFCKVYVQKTNDQIKGDTRKLVSN